MIDVLERIVGAPVALEELKHKPGRRTTLRAWGPARSAIVKQYVSTRAPLVAARVDALADGPDEPLVPAVLHTDAARRLVVLSDLPGRPLRDAVLANDLDSCRRVGGALARWHLAWRGRVPAPLRAHTGERERKIVMQRADSASRLVARQARSTLKALSFLWSCTTVVHRDLYEEQILLDRRVAMIDLDDAAAGPPELDFGNLCAHLQLLGLRMRHDVEPSISELLFGYGLEGSELDPKLLDNCRRLTLVRLACLNDDAELLRLAEPTVALQGDPR